MAEAWRYESASVLSDHDDVPRQGLATLPIHHYDYYCKTVSWALATFLCLQYALHGIHCSQETPHVPLPVCLLLPELLRMRGGQHDGCAVATDE